MYAVQVDGLDPQSLRVEETADPELGTGEVLIEAEAATVNRVDLALVTGAAARKIPSWANPPYTPGWDVCGRVIAHGSGVSKPPIGARIVGFSAWFSHGRGTHSSLVALPAKDVVEAPDGLPASRLTTVGLNGLTAWRAVECLKTHPGQTILIVGAAGAVGGLALDLALLRGVKVIAAVSPADRDLVIDRGATAVVAHGHTDTVAETLRLMPGGVDAVLDTASVAAPLMQAIHVELVTRSWSTASGHLDVAA
ncbi:zinc-binding alcohol dehydrogenase family protein [Streptomyces sp. NPDC094468]|uniref:quinone oxidoreductase family protein n=1 Tax=Streptomyces sp. NPDC094468 TaxID=3366066 RepID=UPI00380B9015